MSNGLELARIKRAEMTAAGIVVERLDPIEKARRNPKSLRLAINGTCWACIGAGHDPNPRGAIRECQILDCSLHPVRPYQRGDGEDSDTNAETENVES